MTILLEKLDTPFETIPFDLLKDEDFLPTLKKAIELAKERVEKIKSVESPNFHNIIEELECSNEEMRLVANVFFNLYSAETNSNLQEIAKEFSPLFSKFDNDILLDSKLFEQVKKVWNEKEKIELSKEQSMLLEKTFKSFIRNGANLNEEDKLKLRDIDEKLSKLSLKFGDNVLADINSFEYVVESRDELAGLPEGAIEAAAECAKSKGKDGKWVFTLDYPSYVPVLTFADNRKMREALFKARLQVGFKNDEYDNREIVKQISSLRHERATLLGYSTHADFILEERMASRPDRVTTFLDDLLNKSRPFAVKDFEELVDFAKKNSSEEKLERWDIGYWSEKLKMSKLKFDEEELRPFFKLENVLNGVFEIANKLYGLKYVENNEISKYHDDVRTFEVYNSDDKLQGIFYADFFPREGKRNGAWMTIFKGQKKNKNVDYRPHVSIVCNFTKPTSSKPSLLSLNEVTTLFHEFGHSLHGILADSHYSSLSGTNVFWDFVELPSQIFENWVFEKECLDLFACHYETNEKISSDLIDKINKSRSFQEGMATVRQIAFASIDMAWHSGELEESLELEKFEKNILKDIEVLPSVEGCVYSSSFSHIFNGGYSAGYYSYKWAEVLDADAFKHFKSNGIFDSQTAKSFQENILSAGGSEHPMTLYKRFRGQEPTVDALLERAGLLD